MSSDHEELGDTLAAVNACLNATSATIAVFGARAIRRGNRELHPKLMGAAVVCSLLFLVSYLIRLSLSGVHRFEGPSWLRGIYLVLLGSHITLAAFVPALVGSAVFLALKGRLASHVKLVKYALPIWLYVSVTGVVIFVMLYGLSGRF